MTDSKYKCLLCKKEISFEAKFFPFCSSVCKKNDLYQWFNEEHTVLHEPSDDQNDE